jgi:general secretion pathway protein F
MGGASVVTGLRALLATQRGRAFYDRNLLRVPVLGHTTRILAIARFSRTLSTLLASGVGIVKSLDIAKHVANNTVMSEAIDTARVSILEGASLAAPMRASGQFPPLVTTMVEVGERSGELEVMLAKVAATYDEQVEATVTRLTSLLEPVLILVMVFIVLIIIMSTLVPLMDITQGLG